MNLSFSETFQLFPYHYFKDSFYSDYFYINILDEDKLGCYLMTNFIDKYDYITILQYKNKKLNYYKNINETKILSLDTSISENSLKMIMTEKGIGLLFMFGYLKILYLSTICLTKNITLYPNLLSEFPVKEFIIPGIDDVEFSFVEIDKNLVLYKNATEIKVGQIFNDLKNFTYFLKVDTFFDSISLKVKEIQYDFICDININLNITTNISTYKESHLCLMNKNYNRINNIIYSNLFSYFNINNNYDDIKIEFIMEEEPREKELEIYINNFNFKCRNNHTKIECIIPSTIFPKLEKIHIYSYLSCFNLIDMGWIEINDINIYNIYSLINYNFDTISEIYEPSEKIKEYNPAMINYYYWFSCLSYCDDRKIEQKNCCNNIFEKWDMVFHKEYSHEQSLLDLSIDTFSQIIENSFTEDEYDYFDDMIRKIKKSNENLGKIVKETKDGFDYHSVLIPLFKHLLNLVYQYNFVIFKNDEYKKIVVAFPGITYYFQILEEIMHSGMVKLPIKSDEKIFNVLEMYYNIFEKLEDDLFSNLESLKGINNGNYQVIFVGHSIGGAIATLSSFYYIKKYKFKAENILITFGQPKVGSKTFAEELTNGLKQIYRIARPNDIAVQFPFKGIGILFQMIELGKLIFKFVELMVYIQSGSWIEFGLSFFGLVRDLKDNIGKYSSLTQEPYIKIFYILI